MTITFDNGSTVDGINDVSAQVNESTDQAFVARATDSGGKTITYSISGGFDQFVRNSQDELVLDGNNDPIPVFEIDADTGVVTVNQMRRNGGALSDTADPIARSRQKEDEPNFENDFEARRSYDIEITATAEGETPVTQDVTILVIDVSPSDPRGGAVSNAEPDFSEDNYAFTAAAGQKTVNGVVVATDEGDLDGSGNPVGGNDTFLTYSIAGGTDANLFTIDQNTGAIFFVDAAEEGTYSFDVGVTDARTNPETDTASVTVTVGTGVPVNTIVFDNGLDTVDGAENGGNNSSAQIIEGTDQAFVARATASNGGEITYSIVGGVDQAVFEIDEDTGVVTVFDMDGEPLADPGAASDNGDDVYTIIVQAEVEGSGLTPVQQTVNIQVVDIPTGLRSGAQTNTAPEFVRTVEQDFDPVDNRYEFTGTEDSKLVSGAVLALDEGDIDGNGDQVIPNGGPFDGQGDDLVAYSISGGADVSLFTIDQNSGEIFFVDAAEAGTYNITVLATDGRNEIGDPNTDTVDVQIFVDNANDDPVFTNTSFPAFQNITEVGTFGATDTEGDTPITFEIRPGGNGDQFQLGGANNSELSFINAPTTPGVLTLTVRATDSAGSSTDEVITVTVQELNIVLGTSGRDRGAQELRGSDGPDQIDGLEGADVMVGLGGDDIYIVDRNGDRVIEEEGQGNDTVLTTANYTLRNREEIENLKTTDQSGTTDIRLTGNNINNTIEGNEGDNRINGRNGDDILFGFGGEDRLNGGQGNDEIRGGDAIDRLNGNGGQDDLFGGAGNDILRGGGDNDVLNGEANDDSLRGGRGDDTLNGGEGTDDLRGGRGNDIMNGGAGDDVLRGGGGDDTFVYTGNDGNDEIRGFNVNRDSFDLTGLFDLGVDGADNVVFQELARNRTEVTFQDNNGVAIDGISIEVIGVRSSRFQTDAQFEFGDGS